MGKTTQPILPLPHASRLESRHLVGRHGRRKLALGRKQTPKRMSKADTKENLVRYGFTRLAKSARVTDRSRGLAATGRRCSGLLQALPPAAEAAEAAGAVVAGE